MAAAAEKAIPKLRASERSKAWWTTEIQRLRTEKSALLRKAKKQPQDEDLWQQWKTARNVYFRTIKAARQESWLQWLECAEGSDIFKACKAAGGTKTTKVPNLQFEGPEGPAIATTFNEKCNAFLTTLFPTRGNTEGNSADTTAISSERPSLERFVGRKQWDWPEILDPSKIERAIFSSSPKKALGPDGIGFAAIQQAYKVNPAPFIALYSALFTKGYYPKC